MAIAEAAQSTPNPIHRPPLTPNEAKLRHSCSNMHKQWSLIAEAQLSLRHRDSTGFVDAVCVGSPGRLRDKSSQEGVASFRCFDAQRSGCATEIELEQSISKDVYGDVCADRGSSWEKMCRRRLRLGPRGECRSCTVFPEKPFLLVNLRLHPT